MKACDPIAGALSGRERAPKPCGTQQRAGSQSRLLTDLRDRWASCVSPGDRNAEPAFQLLKGEAGRLVAVVRTAAFRVGERRAGQAVDEIHQRADHLLDDAAEMWSPRRAPVNGDAVLLAPAHKGGGVELRPVVDTDAARLAHHGPVGALDPELGEPGRLVGGDMG